MSVSASALYAARVAAGTIERDAEQEAMIGRLSRLEAELAERWRARKSSALGWLFGVGARASKPIKGLYIFGDVGRGKTILMDLFFEAAPVARVLNDVVRRPAAPRTSRTMRVSSATASGS